MNNQELVEKYNRLKTEKDSLSLKVAADTALLQEKEREKEETLKEILTLTKSETLEDAEKKQKALLAKIEEVLNSVGD